MSDFIIFLVCRVISQLELERKKTVVSLSVTEWSQGGRLFLMKESTSMPLSWY